MTAKLCKSAKGARDAGDPDWVIDGGVMGPRRSVVNTYLFWGTAPASPGLQIIETPICR